MRYIDRDHIKNIALSLDKLNSIYQGKMKTFLSLVSQQKTSSLRKKLDDLQSFYKREDVKRHLVLCYGLKCCYCESLISSTTYFEVDHFYPKNPSGALPRQFKDKKKYKYQIVNDVKNLHLSCKRCNLNKKDFTGLSLSPNYYYSGTQWKTYTDRFIKKNFSYSGARVVCSKVFLPFVEKLHFNTSTEGEQKGLHASLLLERTKYLNETGLLMHVCYSLCYAQDYSNAKVVHNFLWSRFRKNAHFSRMIVENFGKAYLKLNEFLKKH